MYVHPYIITAMLLVSPAVMLAEEVYGALRGTVTLEATGDSLQHASVLVVQLGRSTESLVDGSYEFRRLPPGKYDVIAHMHPLSDLRQTVEVAAGGEAVLNFSLRLAPVHEEITVTASGREQTALEAFQSVASLGSLELIEKAAASLGDVLENETGVAKRSYGPGTSRPVVRGFDGDRVLILQDGLPTGTLSSQSGDHGEPVNANAVERVEVVRGPATLLYGTNALGGVVNVVTGHHQVHQHPHEGLRGFLTATGGTANAMGGGSGGFEYGKRKWLMSGSGGGLRTGDYGTPLGTVLNSQTQIKDASGSLARYGDRGFFHAGYGLYGGVYGVPTVHEGLEAHEREGPEHGHEHEGPLELEWRRHNARFTGGFRDVGSFLDRLTLRLNYSNWNHREMAGGELGTEFFNKQFTFRGVFDQQPKGRLSGSFGVYGLRRSYKVLGAEQVTPPVTQDAFAAFALEELQLEPFRLQLGGRLETNRFSPDGLPSRAFTGFSGSVGMNAPLWKNGAFVASFSHSYRAPAVEELYNRGPHHGNLAFEIGDPNLKRERAEGFEIACRHQSPRVRGEASFFYYLLKDYVYLAPTGDVEEGLVVAEYRQSDSRYTGAEGRLDVSLHRGVWMKLGFDSVGAQLRQTRTPLPRIPPVRGRIGIEAFYRGLSLRPELLLAAAQQQLYFGETRTAGYAVVNLGASYTFTRSRALHVIGLNVFNAGDRLYRNHVSLIKDFAPEIGRGVRFAYTVRFF